VSDRECRRFLGENSKPNEQQNCSITECPYWQTSSWSNCSGKCGLATRDRRTWCLYNKLKVEDDYCLQMYNEKPSIIEICNQEMYCPNWIIGIWSEVGLIWFLFIYCLNLVFGNMWNWNSKSFGFV